MLEEARGSCKWSQRMNTYMHTCLTFALNEKILSVIHARPKEEVIYRKHGNLEVLLMGTVELSF